MRLSSAALGIFLATFGTARAQVSLDDLDAATSARDSELSAFQERLNDPDPEKALAVMSILIRDGDADQRRMAIRHGLYSTDSAIRATVLRSIFDSKPTLVLEFDPVDEEPHAYYARDINNANGTIGADNMGQVMKKLVGYDEKEACWTVQGNGSSTPCIIRMRGEVVSVWFGGSWGQYVLNASGQLEGEQSLTGVLTKGRIDLTE
ncbi:hypothetical protein [Maritimibacter sp. DP1N21-5]|uniref:hypothetical protein n=1 Tax=Maritimibacter sp. DP1N21-5 TaxID=2836867 RepID=UPI001C447618|nr:hypothetical protein [Maritimibacter sp. DP1N21-5]MBV7408565.1 hypothetical protein [Maritimibacter sp. DP1N21-5]